MKKKLIIIIAAVLLLAAAGLFWGNKSIEVTRYRLLPENLPESFRGFRIVQVSDLHNTDFGGRLIEKIAAEKPDIIVITGDLADYYSTDIPVAVDFAKSASVSSNFNTMLLSPKTIDAKLLRDCSFSLSCTLSPFNVDFIIST